jgi:Spy/CpxP family protein refolding chaperone
MNPNRYSRPRGASRLVALAAVAALAAGLALPVAAMPGGQGHGQGHGQGQGMSGFGLPMLGGPRSIDKMLDGVNATAEQRTQIQQIAAAAATDMKAQHEAGRALRAQVQQLFTQPTLDAGAAEALRQQMLAHQDQASKRMMQTVLDVSRVLTPEQRQQLAERASQRTAMMERHRSERGARDKAHH